MCSQHLVIVYSGGEFTAIIELNSGEHHYKFLVDGHWIHDPNQVSSDILESCPNKYGTV